MWNVEPWLVAHDAGHKCGLPPPRGRDRDLFRREGAAGTTEVCCSLQELTAKIW